MLIEVLTFIRNILDQYLKNSFGLEESPVTLDRLVDLEEGAFPLINKNKMALTLINFEKETSQAFGNRTQLPGNDNYKEVSPPVRLNLDLLFTACFDDYEEALKFLSATINFFQINNSFASHSNLPSSIKKINLEIETLSFNDIHNIWSAMGARYQPSVVYKVHYMNSDDNSLSRQVDDK